MFEVFGPESILDGLNIIETEAIYLDGIKSDYELNVDLQKNINYNILIPDIKVNVKFLSKANI